MYRQSWVNRRGLFPPMKDMIRHITARKIPVTTYRHRSNPSNANFRLSRTFGKESEVLVLSP